MEILAPAGGPESLPAAVRCGATAVYLGGKSLNARKNAANFDDEALEEAVRYCHARGVKVYLTLNTLVLDRELTELLNAVKTACKAGVDAVLAQDLAVYRAVREMAPDLALYASTQMSAHDTGSVAALEALGFSRVVLARELSEPEIRAIKSQTDIELECFVHGALCMCVSGQCYMSAMLGGRSGNRGLCAQPCRLPMNSGKSAYALSLKDLSLVTRIRALGKAGVTSLKIEGRMKRPEYVAAAVTACRDALDGREPDMEALAAVFSRSGFTSGYFDGKPGPEMFGVRAKEDVTAASPKLLKALERLYQDERPLVPVRFALALHANVPARLEAFDGDGNRAIAEGAPPQAARTAPATPEKLTFSLEKTGGTPFYMQSVEVTIDEGLMLPISQLNALRRDVLGQLLALREVTAPHTFTAKPELFRFPPHRAKSRPELRARIASANQLTRRLAEAASLLIVPAPELQKLDESLLREFAARIAVELPRVRFGGDEALLACLDFAAQSGVEHAVAGSLGSLRTARKRGFAPHGDYSLNITNSLALAEYKKLGLLDATVSFELTARQISELAGELPRGILAYGRLPLMVTRNCPVGNCKACHEPVLTDRLGNRFPVRCAWGVAETLNCVPLFLADRIREFPCIDFFTLYFTIEAPEECERILSLYETGGQYDGKMTRGLYYRGIS